MTTYCTVGRPPLPEGPLPVFDALPVPVLPL